MDLEDVFLSLAKEVRKKNIGMDSDIATTATRFFKVLNNSEYMQIILFHDSLYDEIEKITGLMSGFTDHESKMPKSPALRITRVFGEFIKGITYFKDGVDKPAYYRLLCGGRIETCYIESLIYDQLYKNQRIHCDEEYIAWLEQTKTKFNTCFPNVDLQVQLEFRGIYPIYIKIERYKKNKLVSIEIYAKDRYQDAYSVFVQCRLETFSQKHTKQIKQKIQTFVKPRRWTAM